MGYDDLDEMFKEINENRETLLGRLEKAQQLEKELDELREKEKNVITKIYENMVISYNWKDIFKLCPVSILSFIKNVIMIGCTCFMILFLFILSFSGPLSLSLFNIFFTLVLLFLGIITSFNMETFSVLKEGIEYGIYIYKLFLTLKNKKIINREKILSYFNSFYYRRNKHFYSITNGIMGCNKEELKPKDALLLLNDDDIYCKFDLTNNQLTVSIYPDGYINDFN